MGLFKFKSFLRTSLWQSQALIIKEVFMSLLGNWQYKGRTPIALTIFRFSLQKKKFLALSFSAVLKLYLLEMAPLLCNLVDFCFLQSTPFIAKRSFLDEGENSAYLCILEQIIGM